MRICRWQAPLSCFTQALPQYGNSVTSDSRRSDSCLQALYQAENAAFRQNMQHVQRRAR